MRLYSRVLLPRSRYGKYLFKEQVAELVKPHPDTLDLLGAWLAHHGIPSSSISMTHGGAWVTVTDVLVSQANRLLNASYQLYRNTNTNDTVIRTVDYSLPTLLHTHIQAVAPTTHFTSMGVMRQSPRRRSSGTAPAASERLATTRWSFMVTPEYLQSLYKTSEYVPVSITRNKVGVVGFRNDYPSPWDLHTFMTFFRSDGKNADYTTQPVNGGLYNPEDPNEDLNVGIQYTQGMAFPTPVTFYSVGNWQGDSLGMFLHYLVSTPNIPPTISISYDLGNERNLAPGYMTAVCSLFEHLAVRGITVLVGSGTHGVGAGSCQDASGNVQFIAEFPSTCMCRVFINPPKRKYKSLTRLPWFCRSLCHQRRRNYKEPRNCSEHLRWRLLVLLCSPALPGLCGAPILYAARR